ncbi:MAG: hypothetical protein H7Y08_00770 [Rhizobiaceae bacterium]|nr:hypothetical protein [Rhizobiaceae bacterium]
MDKVVQQNGTMVEQATAACHTLLDEANELSMMVESFQINRGATRGGKSSAARHAAPGRAKAA